MTDIESSFGCLVKRDDAIFTSHIMETKEKWEVLNMTKNFVKVLVTGFGIGCVLSKIYDWGVADGARELGEELCNSLDEIVKEANKTV